MTNCETVLYTGELSEKMFFIDEGTVSVVVKNLESKLPDKEGLLLTKLKSGCCFNLAGALLERPAIFDFVCGSSDLNKNKNKLKEYKIRTWVPYTIDSVSSYVSSLEGFGFVEHSKNWLSKMAISHLN